MFGPQIGDAEDLTEFAPKGAAFDELGQERIVASTLHRPADRPIEGQRGPPAGLTPTYKPTAMASMGSGAQLPLVDRIDPGVNQAQGDPDRGTGRGGCGRTLGTDIGRRLPSGGAQCLTSRVRRCADPAASAV